jgi:hypothetical protein
MPGAAGDGGNTCDDKWLGYLPEPYARERSQFSRAVYQNSHTPADHYLFWRQTLKLLQFGDAVMRPSAAPGGGHAR